MSVPLAPRLVLWSINFHLRLLAFFWVGWSWWSELQEIKLQFQVGPLTVTFQVRSFTLQIRCGWEIIIEHLKQGLYSYYKVLSSLSDLLQFL